MDTSFHQQIDQANTILLLLPSRPYFDQIAGGLSLFLSLKEKKGVTIACPSEMLVEFNRLVGVDKISTELGSKNLVIKFSNYKATDIERVSYDIENGEFKLSVIPKSEATPPLKENILLSYSGVAADLVILVGGGNESHFPALSQKDLMGVKKIHVGIKELSVSAGTEILSFARPASCLSELVYSLIKESNYQFDPDIATNLLLGIEAGSSRFMGEGVTADTFQIVADLMRLGGKREAREAKKTYPQGSIPPRVKNTEPLEKEDNKQIETPQDWLGPKIYKGTSLS